MAGEKKDRLAPPLMHAFRAAHARKDAKESVDIRVEGERVIASRRLTARAPISESELRRLVGVDILALLNTTNLESADDLSSAPEVRRSILNYGLPDLSWRTLDEHNVVDIAREVEVALTDFEPRLAPGSVKAQRDLNVKPDEMRIRFLVKAELRAQPVNVQLEFVAEVEVDSGKIKIDRF